MFPGYWNPTRRGDADRPVGRPPVRRCLGVRTASTRRPPGVVDQGSPREECYPGHPHPACGATAESEQAGQSRSRHWRCDRDGTTAPHQALAKRLPIPWCRPWSALGPSLASGLIRAWLSRRESKGAVLPWPPPTSLSRHRRLEEYQIGELRIVL